MAETWDLSLLIDATTRIHDARGMTGQYLGLEARFLPERLFIDFVDPSNRGAFRRRLIKMQARKLDIVRVRLMTESEGSQEFFAALRDSKIEQQWWLMLVASLRDETPALAALERTGLAEGDEFMMLVESAARQLNGEVDLMQVRAELLTEEGAGKTRPDVRERLESKFNEIVAENAYDNIATRPQPGEYLLLKDRAKPAAEVLDKLGAAAERMSIPPADLGLGAKTVPMETLAGDFSQASIQGVVFDLRHDPSRPVQEWDVEPAPRSWIRPVIRSAAAALSGILPSRTSR
ncbi:hypothetical protein [Dongia deserti]|uniref:hypothetical protein n=1 Tax=Dongia deserti TaxID=2268030 RepID=UPI000E655CCA|nr:hypothetical protein [Dongia deserti]